MTEFPSFKRFYRSVHGNRPVHRRGPLPWQGRLAHQVHAGDGWPSAIGVPTGLGKTSCIDIAVWALAAQAGRPAAERTAPTRTWYVVNRRLLVDAATAHAERLAGLLRDPASLPRDYPDRATAVACLTTVAAALTSIAGLGSEQGPLHVTRLRGGAELGARPPDPSQPALVLATVPMFASRWLFRGYGTSRSMRPVDAALAGADALVLLDEAHLARPLAALAADGGPVALCDVGDPAAVLPPGRARPRLVALTATGDADDEPFDLDDEDYAHEVVAERLGAQKPVQLPAPAKDVAAQLAAEAAGLLAEADRNVACVAFTNTPRTARAAFAALRGLVDEDDTDTVLLTGRTRDREADTILAHIQAKDGGAPSGRDPSGRRGKHLVVVATQTLEVGADLDFDVLVTETAGARALTQRLGRLNRLGERNDAAQAVICHPATFRPGPLYGDEPAGVWARLQAAHRATTAAGGVLSLGPADVAAVLGDPDDPPQRVAELLPGHLWEWAKTSAPPDGEAAPRLFYEPLDTPPGTVSVAWRAHVPGHGARLVPPLRAAEAVEVPLGEFTHALEARTLGRVCRLTGERATVEHVDPGRLTPGDQVILPTHAGLYSRHGWDPDSIEPVLDVAAIDDRTLTLTPEAAAALMAPSVTPGELRALVTVATAPARDDEDDWERAQRHDAAIAALLDRLAAGPHHPWLRPGEWDAYIDALRTAPRLATLPTDGGNGPPYLQAPKGARRRPRADVRADAFDELSFDSDASSPELREHHRTVGAAAKQIALSLGLPPDIVAALRRAGEHHDAGKADPRFQRWLDPDGTAERPLAKSSTPLHRREADRIEAGWPRGGRHELLSARLLDTALPPDAEHRDLILHLIASHHGYGRPTIPVVADPAPAKARYSTDDTGGDVAVSGDVSEPDWAQPERFRRLCERYGYWGLALLEAVLRQADHAASGATTNGRPRADTAPVEVL